MKVHIDANEEYPVYSIIEDDEDAFGFQCDLSESDVSRVNAAFAEFKEVQQLLGRAWRKAKDENIRRDSAQP